MIAISLNLAKKFSRLVKLKVESGSSDGRDLVFPKPRCSEGLHYNHTVPVVLLLVATFAGGMACTFTIMPH